MKKTMSLIMAIALSGAALFVPVAARNGRGIGNDRTLGKMTFVMVDRENPRNVLGSFTAEEPIGRFRRVSEQNIPGWRVDRRSFRNNVRAGRGSQTITVPMIRDAQISNFGING